MGTNGAVGELFPETFQFIKKSISLQLDEMLVINLIHKFIFRGCKCAYE